jgi:hypothetical protein
MSFQQNVTILPQLDHNHFLPDLFQFISHHPTLNGIDAVTSRKVASSISDQVIGFFNLPNPPSRTMTVGSTQPLTEMSTRNLPGGKRRPARKADNLTAICEPTV